MDDRRKYLKNIKSIQKSLIFLSNQLKDPNYDYKNLERDVRGYLTELQFNHRIPADINLKESIVVELEEDKDLHVYFAESLENFLTDYGKHIIPEMLED